MTFLFFLLLPCLLILNSCEESDKEKSKVKVYFSNSNYDENKNIFFGEIDSGDYTCKKGIYKKNVPLDDVNDFLGTEKNKIESISIKNEEIQNNNKNSLENKSFNDSIIFIDNERITIEDIIENFGNYFGFQECPTFVINKEHMKEVMSVYNNFLKKNKNKNNIQNQNLETKNDDKIKEELIKKFLDTEKTYEEYINLVKKEVEENQTEEIEKIFTSAKEMWKKIIEKTNKKEYEDIVFANKKEDINIFFKKNKERKIDLMYLNDRKNELEKKITADDFDINNISLNGVMDNNINNNNNINNKINNKQYDNYTIIDQYLFLKDLLYDIKAFISLVSQSFIFADKYKKEFKEKHKNDYSSNDEKKIFEIMHSSRNELLYSQKSSFLDNFFKNFDFNLYTKEKKTEKNLFANSRNIGYNEYKTAIDNLNYILNGEGGVNAIKNFVASSFVGINVEGLQEYVKFFCKLFEDKKKIEPFDKKKSIYVKILKNINDEKLKKKYISKIIKNFELKISKMIEKLENYKFIDKYEKSELKFEHIFAKVIETPKIKKLIENTQDFFFDFSIKNESIILYKNLKDVSMPFFIFDSFMSLYINYFIFLKDLNKYYSEKEKTEKNKIRDEINSASYLDSFYLYENNENENGIIENIRKTMDEEVDEIDNTDNVVCNIYIIGDCRCGKTLFIRNLFKEEDKKKFKISKGNNSTTKKCNIYERHFDNTNKRILYIDTPGFEGKDQHDAGEETLTKFKQNDNKFHLNKLSLDKGIVLDFVDLKDHNINLFNNTHINVLKEFIERENVIFFIVPFSSRKKNIKKRREEFHTYLFYNFMMCNNVRSKLFQDKDDNYIKNYLRKNIKIIPINQLFQDGVEESFGMKDICEEIISKIKEDNNNNNDDELNNFFDIFKETFKEDNLFKNKNLIEEEEEEEEENNEDEKEEEDINNINKIELDEDHNKFNDQLWNLFTNFFKYDNIGLKDIVIEQDVEGNEIKNIVEKIEDKLELYYDVVKFFKTTFLNSKNIIFKKLKDIGMQRIFDMFYKDEIFLYFFAKNNKGEFNNFSKIEGFLRKLKANFKNLETLYEIEEKINKLNVLKEIPFSILNKDNMELIEDLKKYLSKKKYEEICLPFKNFMNNDNKNGNYEEYSSEKIKQNIQSFYKNKNFGKEIKNQEYIEFLLNLLIKYDIYDGKFVVNVRNKYIFDVLLLDDKDDKDNKEEPKQLSNHIESLNKAINKFTEKKNINKNCNKVIKSRYFYNDILIRKNEIGILPDYIKYSFDLHENNEQGDYLLPFLKISKKENYKLFGKNELKSLKIEIDKSLYKKEDAEKKAKSFLKVYKKYLNGKNVPFQIDNKDVTKNIEEENIEEEDVEFFDKYIRSGYVDKDKIYIPEKLYDDIMYNEKIEKYMLS